MAKIIVMLGEVADLQDLANVQITTPSNGQILKYDGTVWRNQNESAGAGVTVDSTITDSSTNPVQSSTLFTAFAGKVNNYTGQSFTVRSLSQATYDGLTPNANTIYLII